MTTIALDADGLVPVPNAPPPETLAYVLDMDFIIDGYAELTGVTLDRSTLVAMRHGIALGQALHMQTHSSEPEDREFADDMVACYGALIFLLDRRIKGAP